MKTFEEVFATLPDGWLTEPEARLLWDTSLKAEGPILEVGCYKGRSTCLLSEAGWTMYCVDPFSGFDSDDPKGDGIYRTWLSRVSQLEGAHNIFQYRVRIEDWRPRPVDFAYLDGDHTYEGTKAQIKKALKCKARLIAIHDVNDSGGGLEVKRAAVEMLGDWNERVERLAVWDKRKGGP